MIVGKAGGAGTNPFQINENGTQNGGGVVLNGNNSIGGKTARGSNLLTNGEKTLVLLVIGDSISSNSCPAYTVTNTTKNDNLNHYDGVVYQYADPYLGPSSGPGSYPGIIADQLINATKFARQITIGCAMGGATSYDFSKYGGFSHRIIAALLYCRRYGYPLSGSGNSGNWAMACIHAFGTNDGILGYSAAGYTNYANSGIQLLRDYGYSGKVFIPRMTLANNVTNATIQGAQAALVNNPLGIYLGADADSLTGPTNRGGDGTHPTATGANNLASLWANIFVANY